MDDAQNKKNQESDEKKSKDNVLNIYGEVNNCLNGIIQSLTKQCNGDVDEKKYCENITGSTSISNAYYPKSAVDFYNEESNFHLQSKKKWLVKI